MAQKPVSFQRLKAWVIVFLLLAGGGFVAVSLRPWKDSDSELSGPSALAQSGGTHENSASAPSVLQHAAPEELADARKAAAPDSAVSGFDADRHEGHGHEKKHVNFDARKLDEWRQTPKQTAALAALRDRFPNVDVQFDAVTGSANHIMAAGRFLTGPAAAGADIYEALKRFVGENAPLFGHSGDALTHGVRLVKEDVSEHTGMRSVVWQQELDGVPLYKTILRANVTKDGQVASIGSHFVGDAEKATQMSPETRATLVEQPPLSFPKAVVSAASSVGVAVEEGLVLGDSAPQGAGKRQKAQAQGLGDLSAGLAWLPVNPKKLVLVWDVLLVELNHKEMFRLLVDATTGKVLVRTSLTNDLSSASYRVHANGRTFKPLDSPRPLSPGYANPNSTQPAEAARTLVTLSALDTVASPQGWIADGGSQTYGNNVDAHLDLSRVNPVWGQGTHAGSRTRVFDFPMVLSQSADTYRDAALTTLFYLCNWYHDKLYSLGFTEQAGNFQQNNFGRGGVGNDAVLADAQDGGGTNNANFSTPPDGFPGRMQMYVWNFTNPERDGGLDAEVVFHEYTHGLSNRLVGGGVGINALQSGGLGEGWSDFYSLALLSDASDDINGNYAAGGYVTGDYYRGVRHYPYTTDLFKNPLTLNSIDPSKGGSPQVHFMGEVWCATLWEVRANLIVKYGWAVGNQLMLQLVTDGMKLSPVNPTFLQARDAIVQADLVNNGAANWKELWRGFAKRGMGASAVVPSSETSTGVTEAFDLPDSLNVSPTSALVFESRVSGFVAPGARSLLLTNTQTEGAITWTVGASEAWISLAPAGGVLQPGQSATVSVAIRAGAIPSARRVHTGTLTFANVTSGSEVSREIKLLVGNPDFYTEIFSPAGNDTAFQSWTFTPDRSADFYAVKHGLVTWFPSDPLGGNSLTLGDDAYAKVSLSGGNKVSLYGVSYSSLYVGSNGCVTLGEGDEESGASVQNHFSKPRIAAFWNDLDPSLGGSISWRQWKDRVAVTFINVPSYGLPMAGNSFQVELFFDGRIRLTCLNISAPDGLIGLSRGTGVPAFFAQSNFSAYGYPVAPKPVLKLSLPSVLTEGGGVLSGRGSVLIDVISARDLVVSLASNLPAMLQVPQSVTIPAGAKAARFDVRVPDNALIEGAQNVVVTGESQGFAPIAAIVLVKDNEAGIGLGISVPASIVEGAANVQGSVFLRAPAASAVRVSLVSSSPAIVRVPLSIVIPAGQTSGTFPLLTFDDSLINGSRIASITARVEGWSDAVARVSVLDNEDRNLVLNLPSAVGEGLAASGSVSVSGALLKPLTVALVSSNPSRLKLPARVTIPARATSASFAVSAANNVLSDGSVSVAVSATAPEFMAATRVVAVLDDEVHHFTFAPLGEAQIQGMPFVVTVTAKNVNDATVSRFNGTAVLSARRNGVPIAISPASRRSFVNGVWTGSVAVLGSHPGIVLSVADASGHAGQSSAFSVGARVQGLTDSLLAGLTLSAAPLSAVFKPTQTQYGAQVLNHVSAVSLTPTAAKANSTIRVNGQMVKSGSPSAPVPLAEGVNSIEVTVTPPDLSSAMTYVVDVLRQPALWGGYDGLIVPSAQSNAVAQHLGIGELTINPTGTFSTKVTLGGTASAVPFNGYFDAAGVAHFKKAGLNGDMPSADIVRSGFETLGFSMEVDWEWPFTHRVVGEVRSGSLVVGSVVLNRRLYTSSGHTVAPLRNVPVSVLDPDRDKGNYTAILPALEPAVQGMNASAYPQGGGFATALVKPDGSVFVLGELADGELFTCKNYLSKDNVLPVHVPLYRGSGALSGEVSFREVSQTSDADGVDLRWFKQPSASDALYPEGWPSGIRVDLLGSKFLSPSGTNKTALGNDAVLSPKVNGLLSLSHRDVLPVLLNNLTIGRTSVIVQGAPVGQTAGVIKQVGFGSSGFISGTFVHPSPSRAELSFRGVVFQKGQRGAGYFMTPSTVLGRMESGVFQLNSQ